MPKVHGNNLARYVLATLLISSCVVAPHRIAVGIPDGRSADDRCLISVVSINQLICDLRRDGLDHDRVFIDEESSWVESEGGVKLRVKFEIPDYRGIPVRARSTYYRVFIKKGPGEYQNQVAPGLFPNGIYKLQLVLKDSGGNTTYELKFEIKTIIGTPL